MFNTSPARIISRCATKPLAYTMAFGGVATGSMKAQEAEMAIIIDIMVSDMPILVATVANNGIIRAAVAVFEANSVRK